MWFLQHEFIFKIFAQSWLNLDWCLCWISLAHLLHVWALQTILLLQSTLEARTRAIRMNLMNCILLWVSMFRSYRKNEIFVTINFQEPLLYSRFARWDSLAPKNLLELYFKLALIPNWILMRSIEDFFISFYIYAFHVQLS